MMKRYSSDWFTVALVACLLALMWVGRANAESAEPICATPDAYFCDDLEDGVWWQTKENANGIGNDGWEGCLYCAGSEAPQVALCGGMGAAGTDCAATSKLMTRTTGAGVNGKFSFTPVDELYVRKYWYVSPGYKWGHQKGMSFERTRDGHFDFGLFHHPFQSAELQFSEEQTDGVGWRRQNQGNTLKMNTPGWYLFEAHIRLNTNGQRNGLLETWLDFCGTDGMGCENKPQTLRMRHTDMRFRSANDTRKIGAIWENNWSNYVGQPPPLTAPPSEGEMRYDQFVVSRAPIGPVNASTGPITVPVDPPEPPLPDPVPDPVPDPEPDPVECEEPEPCPACEPVVSTDVDQDGDTDWSDFTKFVSLWKAAD